MNDGLKMADKLRLPQAIKDFISTHHGHGKAKFFYNSFCNKYPDQPVDESKFTYPGPNPFTKETGILMMADAVEAASRSLKEYTNESISQLVNRIIDSQVADGLLRDTPSASAMWRRSKLPLSRNSKPSITPALVIPN